MVLLRETQFPKIKLTERPCFWHESVRTSHKTEFEKQLQDWQLLADKYEAETQKESYIERTAIIQIAESVDPSYYKIGSLIDRDIYVVKESERKVGGQYEECRGRERNLVFSGTVVEIQENQRGYKRIYPEWELPPKPEYIPLKFSYHDAVWEMQKMIEEVCPKARWEGFWTSYPTKMGYDDTTKEETSESIKRTWRVWREFGLGYEVLVEDSSLVLYEVEIERFHYYPSVGEGSDVGINSWHDKGYW